MRRFSARRDSIDLVAPLPQPEADYGLFHTDDSGLAPAIGLEASGGELKFSPPDAGSSHERDKTDSGARPWREDDLL